VKNTPSRTRVAVTSRSFSKNLVLREELLRRYDNVTFNDAGTSLSGTDLLSFLQGHEKAIVALERIDADLVAGLPELQVISKYGVGLDNIDVDALNRHGKRLGWQGGVNRRSVSELALSFMISLLHGVPQAEAEVRSGLWRQFQGRQLTGKVVGIIGCGHVGKDLIMLLKPFGCRILACDILPQPDFYAEHGVEAVELSELLRLADIVSLHVPLNSGTANLLNMERLRQIKPRAVLVNTARGGIVDEAALKVALVEGHLAAAAFDVFASEPPEDRELLAFPNFMVTPHIGGSAVEAVLAMGRSAIEGLDDNAIPHKSSV
jgi:phosphoglycerate dehydrogenase-like enzyme